MIAKVEPLTSARALRGPFDYALPGEMSALGVGSVVMVPFARRQVLGVVVGVADESELPPERLATPLRALEADVPPELVRLGLWVGEEYCSTPARGLALVLPPGTGTGAKQRAKPRNALTASITDAGRLALAADSADGPSLASDALGVDARRLGVAQRRVLEALSGAPLAAADACRSAGCTHDTLKRLAARDLIALDQVRVRRAPASPRRRRPRLHGSRRRSMPKPATGACCCTASRAAARRRSTCVRPRRRSPAVARRSCSCRKSP